jgi:hypothetical protein
MELEKRYKPVMVKRAIWQRLRMVAAMLESERGVNVSRGDVIVEMLDRQFPHVQATESTESCHQ